MLPQLIVEKILSFNIHPIAELIKPIIDDFNTQYRHSRHNHFCEYSHFYEFVLDLYTDHFNCYFCNKILNRDGECYSINRLNSCEECYKFSHPRDDCYTYNIFQLLEIKILSSKIKYKILPSIYDFKLKNYNHIPIMFYIF